MMKSFALGIIIMLTASLMSEEQVADLERNKTIDNNKVASARETQGDQGDDIANEINLEEINKKQIQAYINSLNISNKYSQLILVSAEGSKATVTMHVINKSGEWEEILCTSGYVGEQGVGEAREGYSKTPKGIFNLSFAFGIKDNPGTSLPYTKVDNTHYWIDDVGSKYYNQFVSTKLLQPDWSSAEHIIDHKKGYEYCIAIDYNIERIKGLGSAFFLHCTIDKPTEGCIGIPREDMILILKNINKNCAIVIDTKDNIHNK